MARYKIYDADGNYWKTTTLDASPSTLKKRYPKVKFVRVEYKRKAKKPQTKQLGFGLLRGM